ncbi:hypothetical protein ACRAWF_47300 [Streptomyces sp. L7]
MSQRKTSGDVGRATIQDVAERAGVLGGECLAGAVRQLSGVGGAAAAG